MSMAYPSLARCRKGASTVLLAATLVALPACSDQAIEPDAPEQQEIFTEEPNDVAPILEKSEPEDEVSPRPDTPSPAEHPAPPTEPDADTLKESLAITEDFREGFVHGTKPRDHQRYIVLHDTESDADAQSIIDWWDSNGNLVAAHFVVNKDGSIWQCAPLDAIVHHAGFGDTGHNDKYGTTDESYDDKRGTTPIGDWAADYGMNSYSIGIEMVHSSNTGAYPAAQLDAVDDLIAYIDAYYGFESEIIDHKAWRSGNSDTSAEFADHLAHYQAVRTHSAG